MEIEVLLVYGATNRGCGQLREQLNVTTVQQLGAFVRGYRRAKAVHPRPSYRFHSYLECEQIGGHTGDRLLEAYERWERSVLFQSRCQNEPHAVMV